MLPPRIQRCLVLLAALAVAVIAATPALATTPGAIFSAQQSTPAGADAYGASPRDPIVSPGPAGTPSEHPHVFCGVDGIDSDSTTSSMLASTTRYVEQGIHSGVWEPQAKYNGVPLRLGTTATGGGKHCLIYYRDPFSARNAQALPNGLNMVLRPGDLGGVVNLGDEIIFKCGPGSSVDLPAPPASCSSNVLSTSTRFPSCWDGVNLDTVRPDGTPAYNPYTRQVYPNDHISHMQYPPCDADHPVPIIRVEQFIRHWVPGWSAGLNPDLFTFGGHPYSTYHADYKVAWNPATMQDFMARCITPNVVCATNIDLAN